MVNAKGRTLLNILVVYYLWQYPLKSTVLSHLNAYKDYSKHRVSYLNIATLFAEPKVPDYVARFQWDLVIFTYTALTPWDRPLFQKITKSLEVLAVNRAVKIACPQDECLNMDLMNQFINDMGVNYLLTAGPESEWSKAYPMVDKSKTKIYRELTGYIDDKDIARITQIAKGMPAIRPIDIGYRAYKHFPWLGRHAMLKWQIGEAFNNAGSSLVTDISSEPKDMLYGDKWWEFLLSCKYFLGTESGCSILDWDGSLKAKTEAYLNEHPNAGFEEVEQTCFPHIDGSYRWRTLSPRHLECAVARTCQILTEGDYNGILKPWVHYIPVKYDLSNIGEVLDIIKTHKDLREHIVNNAWQDIVESGKYNYRTYIPWLLNTALEKKVPFEKEYKSTLIQKRMQVEDWVKWQKIKISLAKL